MTLSSCCCILAGLVFLQVVSWIAAVVGLFGGFFGGSSSGSSNSNISSNSTTNTSQEPKTDFWGNPIQTSESSSPASSSSSYSSYGSSSSISTLSSTTNDKLETQINDLSYKLSRLLDRLELLEKKYELASYKSLANFSFFMGITQDNLEEALRIDSSKVCGITDDGLYFNANNGILANHPDFLEKLFQKSNSLIALHSENEAIINENYSIYHDQFGDEIPFEFHPKIRSTEACVSSTKTVLDIAKKWDTRLHFFHISTLEEALLFDNSLPLHQKKITAEACVHHLWFSEKDYERLGGFIKWNPAIKTEKDKDGLLQCLLSNHLDLIATDHAPHSLKEKTGNYKNILSGGPLVQHSLLAMLTMYQQNKISLEKIIEKMCHAPAVAYRIQERGFIREGYFADLVMVDLHQTTQITRNQLAYKCGWSPFEGEEFQAKILKTFVNGNLVYNEGKINLINNGKRLTFNPLN